MGKKQKTQNKKSKVQKKAQNKTASKSGAVFYWGESKSLTTVQQNDFNQVVEFIRENTGFELDEFRQILLDRRFQIIKNKPGRNNVITGKQLKEALLLARVGLKLPTIAKELGVKYETLHRYFQHDQLLKQQLTDARKNRFTWLLARCFDQANQGWFPAIKYLMERLYGDLLDENSKEDIYAEVRELRKAVFRLMKRRTTEEIEELQVEIDSIDCGEGEVKHTTASALGENIEDAETEEWEEPDAEDTEDPEDWEDPEE